jgi:hypothetical protein
MHWVMINIYILYIIIGETTKFILSLAMAFLIKEFTFLFFIGTIHASTQILGGGGEKGVRGPKGFESIFS